MKRWLTFLIVLTLFCHVSLNAFAADGNVTYSGSAGTFIFSPGSEESPTDLFPDLKQIMPGETVTQKITLKNDVKKGVKVKFYVRSLGAYMSDGNDDLLEEVLSHMTLQIKQLEDTVLFDGAYDKPVQVTDWAYLGTLYSGGEIDLEVTLHVSLALGNIPSNTTLYIDWEFMAEEFAPSKDDPKPTEPESGNSQKPMGTIGTKTGDDSNVLLWIGCAVVAGAGIYVTNKRKNKK